MSQKTTRSQAGAPFGRPHNPPIPRRAAPRHAGRSRWQLPAWRYPSPTTSQLHPVPASMTGCTHSPPRRGQSWGARAAKGWSGRGKCALQAGPLQWGRPSGAARPPPPLSRLPPFFPPCPRQPPSGSLPPTSFPFLAVIRLAAPCRQHVVTFAIAPFPSLRPSPAQPPPKLRKLQPTSAETHLSRTARPSRVGGGGGQQAQWAATGGPGRGGSVGGWMSRW